MATYTDCSGNTQEYNPHLYDLARCSTGYYCGEYTTAYCYGYYLVSKPGIKGNHVGSIYTLMSRIEDKCSVFDYSILKYTKKGYYDGSEWGYYTVELRFSNEVKIKVDLYIDYLDTSAPLLCEHGYASYEVLKGSSFLNTLNSVSTGESDDLYDSLLYIAEEYDKHYKNLCCLKKC